MKRIFIRAPERTLGRCERTLSERSEAKWKTTLDLLSKSPGAHPLAPPVICSPALAAARLSACAHLPWQVVPGSVANQAGVPRVWSLTMPGSAGERTSQNSRFVYGTGAPALSAKMILLLILILTACAPATATSQETGPTPTAVIAGATATQPAADAERDPQPRPTIAPFRFVLPTPGAEPVSGWRPPLYPVPWAVSSYDHFYFARPIAADNVNWPLAEYRYGGVFFAPNIVHTGVDIDAEEGTPILAAGSGTVVSADWGLFTEVPGNITDPYGQAVVLRHDFGYKGQTLYTVYAHMSEISAVVGQHVSTGDVLGLVGDTGITTGPHLHFEVRLGGNTFFNTYNPELWMAPPQGWGVLVGRLTDEDGKLMNQFIVEVRPMPSEVPLRKVLTYAVGAVNEDAYYHENLVLSDLPAGLYKIAFEYKDKNLQFWADIYPGQVTYFTFSDEDGFQVLPPPVPTLDFLPGTAIAVP